MRRILMDLVLTGVDAEQLGKEPKGTMLVTPLDPLFMETVIMHAVNTWPLMSALTCIEGNVRIRSAAVTMSTRLTLMYLDMEDAWTRTKVITIGMRMKVMEAMGVKGSRPQALPTTAPLSPARGQGTPNSHALQGR
jgi:hypothetical protein